MIRHHRHVLAVPDADASASFFLDVLGFRNQPSPEGWRFVIRDGCMLMLGSCPDDLPPSETGCHSYFGYWEVADADAYHAEMAGRGWDGAPPEDKPWGMREFTVRTPDGHGITVGQER